MKVNWRMRRKLVENNKTKNIINSFFPVHCLLYLNMFSLLAAASNLIKAAKNGIHRKANGRHVNCTKVKKQRASHPGVGFFRVSFFTYVGLEAF